MCRVGLFGGRSSFGGGGLGLVQTRSGQNISAFRFFASGVERFLGLDFRCWLDGH